MSKLIMLKGLPASSKSTWAKEQCRTNGFKRINKDLLREMFDDSKWSSKNEKLIIKMRNIMLDELLKLNHTVLIDDTNMAPFHEDDLRQIARNHNADFEIKVFDTPLEECIRRDALRANPVGEKAIRAMHKKYLSSFEHFKELEQDTSLPRAILVDIDGCLAHFTNRGPYAETGYLDDRFDTRIADLVDRYRSDHKIIVCSGRDEKHRAETEQWFAKHNFKFDHFYMRPRGDTRKDSIIKTEIFETYIQPNYYITLAIDDRDQVVQGYRQLGLVVLQCADGSF